jgi:ribosomal protein S18 acetylase RimI-like enzyme
MPLTLRPATVSDAPDLLDIYFSAFSDNPLSQLRFPRNNPAVYDFLYNLIISGMADPDAHYLCITSTTPDSPGTETLIALARWNGPSAPSPLDHQPVIPTWPSGADVELSNHYFRSLVQARERLMAGRRHWHLALLATRPEFQGRGAAGMLMRWGLERADEEALEAYVEASPQGEALYERFGFRERERLILDLEGKGTREKEFVEIMMVRPVMGRQ